MTLSAGELVATMKLEIQPFLTGLAKAKEVTRTSGAELAMHLRIEPNLESEGYRKGLQRMVEDSKRAAASIHESMRPLHDSITLKPLEGVGTIRAQLRAVTDDAERMRKIVGAPLRLGGGGDFTRLSEELKKLQEQMDRLRRTAAQGAPVGRVSDTASRDSASSGSHGGGFGQGLMRKAGYMAGTAAIFGVGAAIASTITATASFETEIFTMGAISGASAAQLAQVSQKALQLGADFTIANASASDAAVVMGELVKGGLSVQGAMDAARGALQLAAAGGISFVQAADLETAAIAQFGLKATDAGHVADVLANAAHAARGSIMELGTGLNYAGTLAHQAGYSLEATASVLAEFAKFGLTGSIGGTTFKDFIMRIEKAAVSTGAAGKAYKELGLDVYNTDGTLKSAGAIADQLGVAHKKLAPMIYNSAMQTLFGARAITGANILMSQGSEGLKGFTAKIHDLGGAQAFSTARMKGLGGSFANLTNQVQTAQVQLGEKFSPELQKVVNHIADAVPKIANFFAGPSLGNGFKKVGDFFQPLITGAQDLIAKAWPYIQQFGQKLGIVWGEIVTAIKPVVDALGGLFSKMSQQGGAVDTIGQVLNKLGDALVWVYKGLKPLDGMIASTIKSFGDMSPVAQTITLALGGVVLLLPKMIAGFKEIGGFKGMGSGVLEFIGKMGLLAGVAGAIKLIGDAQERVASTNASLKGNMDTLTTSLVANKGAWSDVIAQQNIAAVAGTGDFQRLVGAGVSYTDLLKLMTQQSSGGAVSGALFKTVLDETTAAWKAGRLSTNDYMLAVGRYLPVGAQAGKNAKIAADNQLAFNKQLDESNAVTRTVTEVTRARGAVLASVSGILAKYTGAVGDSGKVAAAADTHMQGVDGRIKAIGIAAKNAAGDTSAFYDVVAGAKGKPDTFVTPMMQAFADYTAAVKEADATTQVFVFTMDLLAGRNISVEDAMRANAAAARAIGADLRKAAADTQAYTDAQTKLADVKKHLNDGTSQATTGVDVAAAQRAVADAFDQTKAASDGAAASDEAYQKTAALRIEQVAKAASATGGFANAVQAATAEMGRQRQAFIDQQPAADIASGAAGRLADKWGLVPKNVTTILKADPTLAILAFAEFTKAAGKATADRITKLGVDSSSALAVLGVYGGSIKAIPKEFLTKFNADIATAKSEGLTLYSVYDKTTGKWTAQFETPNAASAQQTAGDLIRQYDQARGTWTANLTAEDLASQKIDAVASSLAKITDKTVTISVNAAGGVRTIQADGSFAAGPNQKGLATGGMVSGPGSGTSDSIPVRLSNGEGINTAAAMSKKANRDAMHFMNAGGTIPGFAKGGIVGAKINMVESGDINPALAQIQKLYANTDKSLLAANAAMSAAAAVAATPAASSAGVEQWRSLATSVFASKGVPLQYVQTLLNQMNQESSGNPAAINLTDSNAMAGHPSKGLLQFIDGTFAANADPGFNTNIWDPASQFHAFVNYINNNYGGMAAFTSQQQARGWGAYATGGMVRGGGSGTSDSITAKLSNGEGINTASAMAKPSNRNAMNFMNAGGTIPGFARGGLVGGVQLPSAFDLAGKPPSDWMPGVSATAVAAALIKIATAVSDARTAATGKAATAATELQKLVDTKAKYAANLATAEGRLQQIIKSGGVALATQSALANVKITQALANNAASVNAAEARLSRVTDAGPRGRAGHSNAAAVAAAEARLARARTLSQIVSAEAAVAKARASGTTGSDGVRAYDRSIGAAQTALDKARARAASSLTAIEARITILAASKASSVGGKIEMAQLQLAKVQALGLISVGHANRVYLAAEKTAKAYALSAKTAEQIQAAQQKVDNQQIHRAMIVDSLQARLAIANGNLATMKTDRSNMAGGIASTVIGTDGGLTGYSQQRGTAASFLRGQAFDLGKIIKFRNQLALLRKEGLSKDQLSSLASAGVDSAGVTVNALATGTKNDIAQANKIAAQIKAYANATGDNAAGAYYDNGIKSAQGFIKGLTSQERAIEKVMINFANTALAAMKKALGIHSPSRVFHNEVGVMIGRGVISGIDSQVPAVARSASRLVGVPSVSTAGQGITIDYDLLAMSVARALNGASMDLNLDNQVLAKAVLVGNQQRSRR